MRIKGRHWVLLWLALFLVVAIVVIARGSAAYRLAGELRQLRAERGALEARRAELETRIRASSSRLVLLERAQRAGLHIASDSEITLFPLPGNTPEGSR
ncbi:MAG: hypothetical protein ABI679_01095 [Gemmatimonadota bacterium]